MHSTTVSSVGSDRIASKSEVARGSTCSLPALTKMDVRLASEMRSSRMRATEAPTVPNPSRATFCI